MIDGKRSQGFRRIANFLGIIKEFSRLAQEGAVSVKSEHQSGAPTLRRGEHWRAGFGRKCAVLRKSSQHGFTIVEMVLACAIFPLIVVGLSQGYDAVRRSYTISKQLNEMYAVLSACPEIDRALAYDSLSSSTNCYPNNTFKAEGGGSTVITYAPTLTVSDTTALAATDPLQTVPDSKVINIQVGFQKNTATKLQLRMLITRGGIGQQ